MRYTLLPLFLLFVVKLPILDRIVVYVLFWCTECCRQAYTRDHQDVQCSYTKSSLSHPGSALYRSPWDCCSRNRRRRSRLEIGSKKRRRSVPGLSQKRLQMHIFKGRLRRGCCWSVPTTVWNQVHFRPSTVSNMECAETSLDHWVPLLICYPVLKLCFQFLFTAILPTLEMYSSHSL